MSKGKKLETFNTAYASYKKNSKEPLDKKTWINLLNGFAEYLMNCLTKGETIYLPEKLGAIQVIGKKLEPKVTDNGIEGLTINWGATHKLWKECQPCKQKKQKVYLFNEHSDGIRYRFMWSRTAMLMTNKYLYTYIPNRKSKKKLYEKILEGTEYQILEGRYAPYTRLKNKVGKYK
jgi:hypothetical protein